MSEAKKIGRPTQEASPGTRVSLGLKVTADIKTRIDEAAQSSGRTQSQEAEYRLQRSFRDDALFSSDELHRWAILLAGEFHKAGAAAAGHAGVDASDRAWMKDPACMLSATHSIMSYLVRDLVRNPGLKLEEIFDLLTELRDHDLRLAAHLAGRLKIVDEHGRNAVGFIEKKDEDDGPR